VTHTANAATVPVMLELRDWVVDFQRPTILPRVAPYKLLTADKMRGLLANNSYPGPSVIAKQGDIILVTVVNKCLSSAVSIIWEGVVVQNKTHALIPPQGGEAVYQLLAKDAGTFWWHASFGFEAAMGLQGALIVESPIDDVKNMYEDERVVVLADARPHPQICLNKDGAVIDGCNSIVKATFNGAWGDGSWIKKGYPVPILEVVKGKCYRLRFLGLGPPGTHKFGITVQDHNVQILKNFSASAPVPSFEVPTAAAVDVLLCADQSPIVDWNYNIALTYSDKNATVFSFAADLKYVANVDG